MPLQGARATFHPMRESLSLHLSLFRRQKAEISRAVEGGTPAFRAYERRYRAATRSFERIISLSEVEAEVARADLVYVGDYHTLRLSQQSYLELLQAALRQQRKVVLAIEVIEGRHQASLDAYLAGKLGERGFLERTGHLKRGGFDLWPGFRPILELARTRGLEVLAIDRRARGGRSLELRDRYAASRIAEAARRSDRPRVLVLIGQFHVTPSHLPARVRQELSYGPERHLVVYQNCENIYFRLLERGLARGAEAVRIREGELCLLSASPLACQQSFLDYLEGDTGEEQLHRDAAPRFQEMARQIGSFAGVEVGPELAELEVATVMDADFLDRLKRRGRFTRAELGRIRQQVLSRESYYIPRARMAYLATLSLNHAAEEAAHFVRHCSLGHRLSMPRTRQGAFYSLCLEEMFGFFGAKLVNPGRGCLGIREWARTFQTGRAEERRIAAFVLAHKAAEEDGAQAAGKLLPRGGRLFQAVGHALGYLLGQALFQAFDRGRLEQAEIQSWFRDPFPDPRSAYFELSRRLAIRGRKKHPEARDRG